jgi:hypothetical protein
MVFCPEIQIFGKTGRSPVPTLTVLRQKIKFFTKFFVAIQYMQALKLLVRVAFICNICFLLASLIRWLPNPPEGQVVSTVIVMGYLMGLPVNGIVFCWALILAAAGKWRAAALPVWLMVFNFVIFCLQFIALILHLK